MTNMHNATGITNALKISHLNKKFGDHVVLKDFDMEVKNGDIFGFLGPNGIGKTTTIRILCGILTYDSGDVEVLGSHPVLNGVSLRKRINVMPESNGYYGWMTPIEYLNFFGNIYGVKLDKEKSLELLSSVGLDNNASKLIDTFSRGMKQRLGIARSIINKPEILFMDEPTSGLDPKGRKEIHNLLKKINSEENTTIVISTHILDDVERLCDSVGILYEKHFQYQGALPDNMEHFYLNCIAEGETI